MVHDELLCTETLESYLMTHQTCRFAAGATSLISIKDTKGNIEVTFIVHLTVVLVPRPGNAISINTC